MKHKGCLLLLSSALILALCLLGGCGEEANASPEASPGVTPGAEIENTAPPEENRAMCSANMGWCSTENGLGFYIPGSRVLNYYDPEYGQMFAMCSQSGCCHTDESCAAWIGENVAYFAPYDGAWWSISNESDGSVVIRRIDPESRQREVAAALESTDEVSYYTGNAYISHGYIYGSFYKNIFSAEGQSSEALFMRFDLDGGGVETLFSGPENVNFAGSDGQSVLLLVSGYDAEPLTFSEYAAQFPDGDYGEYIDGYMDEHLSTELRLYSFDMSSYETLASEDVWLSPSLYKCRYGDLSLYAVGDTLYCYDFAAGESRELCTQEGLVNFWAMDGKAFYISNTGTLELRYCDLAGGPETLMENEGRNAADGVIVISPSAECAGYFYGIRSREDSVHGVISKADYYAENYDALTVTG